MGFNCGIVGLPNVGKSTIFNALTSQGAASENYPFCTIDPNVGRVIVPDPRLDRIQKYVKTQKVIPATMEFVDIAGLVKGASQGEGLGNQFLGHIRSTQAIAHVVRCFESEDITHVDGSLNATRDIETIQAELIYADHSTVEKALARTEKLLKTNDKSIPLVMAMLKALETHLQRLSPARGFPWQNFVGDSVSVANAFRDLHLISAKPVIYVENVDEEMAASGIENEMTQAVASHAEKEGAKVVKLCGKLEEELAQVDEESRAEMIEALGMKEPGLAQLIREGYSVLNLQTYFTAGEKEVRAWTINKGDTAPEAAGKIHSDFARGFICAEVFTISDLERCGSKAKLKELGLLRTEGRDYVVSDGDVMEFRFNV
jgi:ribosome-binding ATPase